MTIGVGLIMTFVMVCVLRCRVRRVIFVMILFSHVEVGFGAVASSTEFGQHRVAMSSFSTDARSSGNVAMAGPTGLASRAVVIVSAIEKRNSLLYHGSKYSSDSEGDGPSLEKTTFFCFALSTWI